MIAAIAVATWYLVRVQGISWVAWVGGTGFFLALTGAGLVPPRQPQPY